MALMFLRRRVIFRDIVKHPIQQKPHLGLYLRNLRAVHNDTGAAYNSRLGQNEEATSSGCERSLRRSPLFLSTSDQYKDYKIDIVDDETWQVSTGFADVWKDTTAPSLVTNATHSKVVNYAPQNSEDPDFDEIDDLRICGNLFYKLDRNSKEYEEHTFDFHRRKKNKLKETTNSNSGSGLENVGRRKDEIRERKTNETPTNKTGRSGDRLPKVDEMDTLEGSFIGKKQRTPTFNQLTAPYHEPFCLDIFISNASVRACIVHRATSNVVAVAHSISKDLKFDLGSTKNATACAAVGKVLAQRALADDIHNVVYTPRKGEKLEGKLRIVLQSVINNGVCVKVKIKQKKVRKASFRPAAYKHT